jgi:hypothetical protein
MSPRGNVKRKARKSLALAHNTLPGFFIEKMTNHERSLWGKAGYPRAPKKLDLFLAKAARRAKAGMGRIERMLMPLLGP